MTNDQLAEKAILRYGKGLGNMSIAELEDFIRSECQAAVEKAETNLARKIELLTIREHQLAEITAELNSLREIKTKLCELLRRAGGFIDEDESAAHDLIYAEIVDTVSRYSKN